MFESIKRLVSGDKTAILFFENQQVIVDVPTLIGRSQMPHTYEDRTMPIDISGVNNQIIIGRVQVSRNHALVWPEANDQGEHTGRYLIQDLKSSQGTFIKKKPAPHFSAKRRSHHP